MNNQYVYELFSRRFEPDGSDYLFRTSVKAPAVRVTASERDRFLAEFRRGWRLLRWAMLAAVVIAIGLPGFLILASIVPEAWLQPLVWGSLAVVAVPYFVIYHRLWTAPATALRGRAQAAPARSPREARKSALDRLTWGQLGMAALLFAAALWRAGARSNLLVGWNRLWLVGAGVAVLVIAVQAFRKWRSSTPQS